MIITDVLDRAGLEAMSLRQCVRTGLLRVDPPSVLARGLWGMSKYGAMGGVLSMSAARYPDRVAVVDELGSLTYAELDQRSNALANAWLDRGFAAGGGIAILARNHRGFLDASYAAAKVGARTVLLNTDFAGPQITEVCAREGVDILVHDDEYAEMVGGVQAPLGKFLAWSEDPDPAGVSIESLIGATRTDAPPRPAEISKIIILTSGTTGTPKGAQRSEPKSLAPFGGLFSKVPYRSGEVMECCAPMFHALGYAQSMLAAGLGHTLVLRRRFDPEATLASLAANRVSTVIAVPVMLQRLVDLGPEAREGLDLSHLRIIFVAGSQLGSDLCVRVTEAFGPVIYNLYGSTEVAYATIATSAELAVEPGSVGSIVPGTIVKILDDDGREVPTGTTGRIFVANAIQFSGYTGGGSKEVIDGLMSSGDVGHFDTHGLLFIDGRDDDMIVSGGENLFPGEIEELLAGHPGIVEVAAIGVPDEKFGMRLHVFAVRRCVLDGQSELTEDAVKDYVRENLARFKTPRAVTFLDELPRNPTGKVLKRQLAQQSQDS
ncbi:MAG: Plipastatin synthase subunit [Marmoricola sp.]|nr:Plipastatin synthase subunit [Marmoricola sp.]